MTDPKPGDRVIDQLVRGRRHAANGTPIDQPLTDAEREQFTDPFRITALPRRAGTNPPLPLSGTHDARVDALHGWYLDLIAIEGMSPLDATRKVIDAAVPNNPAPPLPFGAKVLAFVLAVLFAAVTFPAVLWVVGHGIVPMWVWGTAWV